MSCAFVKQIQRDRAAALYDAYQQEWGLMVAVPLLRLYTGKPSQ